MSYQKKSNITSVNGGAFKIVHFNKYSPEIVHTLFYDSENQALFGIQDVPSDNEYIIFKQTINENNSYTWELLPYGYDKKYKINMFIISRIWIITIILLVIYFLTKK